MLITVVNTFSTRQLTSGVQRLFAEKQGSFRVKGRTSIKLPDDISKEPIPLSFDESGTFTLR